MRDFRNYDIWKTSMKLAKDIYSFSQQLPDHEKFGIISQIRRASVSIPSNIAEGCSRAGDDDFKRFLEIALGSAFELETQLILIETIYPINKAASQVIINDIHTVEKGINSLITKIKMSKSTISKSKPGS